MTKEELAEEYVQNLLKKDDEEIDNFFDENLGDLKLTTKQAGTLLGIIKGIGITAFLAGCKAGKPKWHDLRKDPEDFPPKIKLKYTDLSSLVITDKGFIVWYDHENNFWRDAIEQKKMKDEVIKWCEIPKYKEE